MNSCCQGKTMYLGLQKYSLAMYNVIVTCMIHWPVAAGKKTCNPGHIQCCWDLYSANIMLICFGHAKYVWLQSNYRTVWDIFLNTPCYSLFLATYSVILACKCFNYSQTMFLSPCTMSWLSSHPSNVAHMYGVSLKFCGIIKWTH